MIADLAAIQMLCYYNNKNLQFSKIIFLDLSHKTILKAIKKYNDLKIF